MTRINPSSPQVHDAQPAARDHLALHVSRLAQSASIDKPVMVCGEGPYVTDLDGKRYLDAFTGLFGNQLGHGRADLVAAAATQARELGYFPLWTHAHPRAIELAERLTSYAPGDLNRVFYTTDAREAAETAWKLAKNYFKVTGKPTKHKVISVSIATHGATLGAVTVGGRPRLKSIVERPHQTSGFADVDSTTHDMDAGDPAAFGRWAADQIAAVIEREGPDTVAAVVIEPVQNAGGVFTPPPGYFQRVREICDEYDVLLVSDEAIWSFGRLGYMFGAERYEYQPDIITVANGLTSGYAPLGAMIASDRVMEPFLHGRTMFAHGYTFGGHPVGSSVALATLNAFEAEGVLAHARANEESFRLALDKVAGMPMVRDIRGAGFFYGIELAPTSEGSKGLGGVDANRLHRALSASLFEAGLLCEVGGRTEPVIRLSPPLICERSHFDEMAQILEHVLTEFE